MSHHQTLNYVQASVQRAANEGARVVELSVKDMIELLPLIESGACRERSKQHMRPVGWASPHDIREMRRNKGHHVKLKRCKSPRHCMMIYHADDLPGMEKESLKLMADAAEKYQAEQDRKAQAVQAVPEQNPAAA